MNFGGKEFNYYWKIIKIPVIILVAWSILGLIFALISFGLYTSIFSNWAGWILTIAVFGFIGYSIVKDHEGTPKLSLWAGGIAGVITGFIGAIVGILMIYLIPDFASVALAKAAANPEVSAEMMEGFLRIGAFIGLITGPLFSGIIGAILAWLGSLISKKL